MQSAAIAAAHRTTEVTPMAPWRVTGVTAASHHGLLVTFADGLSGRAELADFLASARVDGTVFAELRDPATFARVGVTLGAVSWPNGADLAPDAMYDAILAQGVWRPA